MHPHDAMTKEVLKATFYRATRDPVLREKYFTRKALEHLDRIDDLLLALVKRLRKEPRHVSSKGISNIGEEIVNIVEKMTEELETLKDDSTIGVENRELFIARMNKIDENLTDIANSLRRSEQKGESHERTHKEKKK